MANFQMHFNTASLISAISSSTLYYGGIISKKDTILLFSAGIIGGILPDIDSDNSTPTKIMQYVFANLISFFVLFNYIGIISISNLIFLWMLTFLSVMSFFYLFNQITTHRGMFHSIPAGIIFWFTSTSIFYYIFHYNIITSWYFGMFIFIGYITHLILDEIYSIDISGMKIKKSFGTAFKFWSRDYKSTFLFYLLCIILFFITPDKNKFINSFTKFDIIITYHKLLRNYQR